MCIGNLQRPTSFMSDKSDDWSHTYNGRSGKPLRMSWVVFLPNAGLELILRSAVVNEVEPSKVLSSTVVSIKMGCPIMALSPVRLFRFHIVGT